MVWFTGKGAAALILAAMLAACKAAPAAETGADWASYDGPTAQHYSPLDQIREDNVGRLGLAWYYDIDVGGSSMTAPVAADGVLYFAAGRSQVHAMDAATGKLLWKYDPNVGELAGDRMRPAWGSRGIAYAKGRVFVGTMDGRLIALDARTGRELWTAMTVEKGDGRYITGAPWVFGNKVVIGHGGADFAMVRGYVTAYDQATGTQAWRFYTVPGDPAKGFENKAMERAAKTWTGQWWKHGGGGTVWNAMAYDPRFNRLYIGTGNGSPWNQKLRSPGGGDNLYLCSIIALDADTGEYVWHYQVNPGETWDYNAAMDIELADLPIGGKLRPVILHAPKNGFFYVIDRETGKLLSAEPFARQNWAVRIDLATGRPIERPEARYPGGKPAIVYPSPIGAHPLEAMSFNPRTGLVYMPTEDRGAVFIDPPSLKDWTPRDGQRINTGLGVPPMGLKPDAPSSALLAWNPVTQKPAWKIPGDRPQGIGGTATTAGNLVLFGRGNGQFTIVSATTGKQLWAFDAQTAVLAQPITYLAGGRQYISVIAGSRLRTVEGSGAVWDYRTQKWRMLTFALDGKGNLPKPVGQVAPLVTEPGFTVDPARAALGATVFAQRCRVCHGPAVISGGAAPELRRSTVVADPAAFASVLHDGLLVARGMPQFPELTTDELAGLRHYIRQRARETSSTTQANE
ncbi:MAG TPA: PQQ-dependent dehydrogenase, methanol/ethanol family [Novosphingobium sp.]|nr:PQQ-dependent dehydrogenase, methanol/ethanol family [Novosphingobium sp.]